MRFSKNMKRSKIKDKDTKISSPFDTKARKTERTAVAILMSWMRNIIENKNLDLGLPDVEISTPGRRYLTLLFMKQEEAKKFFALLKQNHLTMMFLMKKNLKNQQEKKQPNYKQNTSALQTLKLLYGTIQKKLTQENQKKNKSLTNITFHK